MIIFCIFDKTKQNEMPNKEYRILVNGKIEIRSWSPRMHAYWVDFYSDRGVKFTEEIVDLR